MTLNLSLDLQRGVEFPHSCVGLLHWIGWRELLATPHTDDSCAPAYCLVTLYQVSVKGSQLAINTSNNYECMLELLVLNRLTRGYVCGVIVHPFSSTSPSFGIPRVILSPSNTTMWWELILAPVSVYMASIACKERKPQFEIYSGSIYN